MIFLRPIIKNASIKIGSKKVYVPMSNVLEITPGLKKDKVQIKSLTGEVMIYDGQEGEMLIDKPTTRRLLEDRGFTKLDHFNYITIK